MGAALYIGDGKDDVRRRLLNSVCRYKGRPVLVTDTRREVVAFYDVVNGNPDKVDHRDKDFDYRSPPLGYCNFSERAYYLYRVPSRDVARSGLASENLGCDDGVPFSFADMCVGKTILGEYPTYQDALDKVTIHNYQSWAFSRHFALGCMGRGNVSLLHRGRVIGLRESGRFRLLEGQDSSIMERLASKSGVPL